MKEGNGENGHSCEAGATSRAPTHVTAPSVDPHLNSRYFKVVYRGAVAVRSNPAEPAPEIGQVSKRANANTQAAVTESSSVDYGTLCRGGEISYRSALLVILEEGSSSYY